jgi:8-oxo-dGTP pyrophosphatase MutT (NUDIX family)
MYNFDNFVSALKESLNNESKHMSSLHNKMSPVTRRLQNNRSNNISRSKNKARQSAVLILIYPIDNIPHVLFIKRAKDKTVHSGQISFPGGKKENSDSSHIDTALREAEEEVGISKDYVEILGQLSKFYIPPSNFDVYPIIGVSSKQPRFVTNHEVDMIIEVEIRDLTNEQNQTYKKIKISDGNEYVVPCYYIKKNVIWGATAMILSELMNLLE